MAKLTRLGFFKRTSAGAATLGLLAVPGLTAASESPEVVDTSEMTPEMMAEPLVAHVRDLASGEIAVMSGAREVIIRDTQIVARLLKAAR